MQAIAHPDLELQGTMISDVTLGTRYSLTPDAAWLFLQLQQEPRIERLVPLVARQKQITQAEAKQAVYTLLGLLNNFGGVRLQWDSSLGEFPHLKTRSAWRRRYSDTAVGFISSMVRAYGAGVMVATVIMLACRIVLGPAFSSRWLLAPALLLTTCVLHEAGHALAARATRVRFVLLARPGFAAIMYHRPDRQRARLIAFFGPLTAVLFCAALGQVFTSVIVRCLFVAAGLIHACSLLPFLADGKTLWRNI